MKEVVDWPTLKKLAKAALKKRGLNGVYEKRLGYELDEVEKQGANRYWVDLVNARQKFDTNKNGLLLPWLLGRLTGDADVDPIKNRQDPLVTSSKHSTMTDMVEKLGRLPFDVMQDDDKPDIDIDCLPRARDRIKDYAAERYGVNNVASVGTWSTYLFKNAIGDAYRALGCAKFESNAEEEKAEGEDNKTNKAVKMTVELPDDVNDMRDGGYGVCKGKVVDEDGERECGTRHNGLQCPACGSEDTETPTLARLIADNDPLRHFIDEDPKHKEVIDVAARLVGRIKNAGKHAGAIIIADRDLFGNVPMVLDRKAMQWVSIWTEGRNTQLSKFGYNKWDILGLKNLWYVYECCKMIEDNHGVSFGDRLQGLEEVDPEKEQAGVYWKDGKKIPIPLHDPEALRLANEQKTDAIFQFDTDLAKRTLSNGVRSFWDLLIFNAMGHPGPMAMIPEYVDRRDNPDHGWKSREHELVLQVLDNTRGIIVYQEQLTDLWQLIAGFTGPESQAARKAVAKKWKEKLKPVRQKWIDGSKVHLGEDLAIEWWDDRMETFGRYAFNKSHAVAYCLLAYLCLWFKAYYPEEWWAAVMGRCNQNKLERYMSAARAERVKFGEIDINRMTVRPVAHAGQNQTGSRPHVALGLMSLKKVGDSLSTQFADTEASESSYNSMDEFIASKGKHKTILERLIKLGAFTRFHHNIKATWRWYLHKYGGGRIKRFAELSDEPLWYQDDDGNFKQDAYDPTEGTMLATKLKNHHKIMLLMRDGWNKESIEAERERQVKEYKDLYPKRKNIPKKVLNWQPDPKDTRERIMSLYEDDDYELEEILEFEKEFLGYYWHSPCELYNVAPECDIDHAKFTGRLEGVITKRFTGKTKNDKPMLKLIITDGQEECLVILWDNEIRLQPEEATQIDAGVRLKVNYDEDRGSFTLQRGTLISKLWTKKGWQEFQDGDD